MRMGQKDIALRGEQKDHSPSCLEDDTGSPQRLSTQLHVRPLRNGFQVAADCWVGIVQGHAAQPKGRQDPPDPERNSLHKRSAPQKEALLAGDLGTAKHTRQLRPEKPA